MSYLGFGLSPKKISVFGIVFGIDNLKYQICCKNWLRKIVSLLELLNPHSNCVRHQHCFLYLKMMGQEHLRVGCVDGFLRWRYFIRDLRGWVGDKDDFNNEDSDDDKKVGGPTDPPPPPGRLSSYWTIRQ